MVRKLKSIRWWDNTPEHMRPDRLSLSVREKFGYWFLRTVLRCPWHGIQAMGMLADMELTAEALYRAGLPITETMPIKEEGEPATYFLVKTKDKKKKKH
jgi:hypothetical protein